jgi:hypothetical protein
VTVQGGTIRIEVGFKFNANLQKVTDQNPPFTLDDPVLGELDVAELPGGDVWIDISQYFIDGLEVRRGRNRAVDLFTAGTAAFRLDNRDRTFDPTNAVSPFFGQLTPMRPVRISSVVGGTQVRLFVGFVTDWTSRYARPTDAWVDVDCVDAFILFAADELPAVTPVGDGEKAGARIGRILNQINFGPQRDLSDGLLPLAETTFDTNALALMQEAAASDFGLLFVARDGTVVYRTPYDIVFGPGPVATFVQANVPDAGIRYHGIDLNTSAELLYNIVQVVWDGGTEVVQDAVSVDEFLPRTLQLRTALKDQSSAEFIGGLVLSQYAEPKPRFRQITVKMHDRRLSVADRLQVAALDIGDVITVVRKPPSIDYSDVVTLNVPVEGVEWRFTRDGWSGTFVLGDPATAFLPTVGVGGTVTVDEVDGRLFKFHTFTGNGTFDVSAVGSDSDLRVLVVGGGGGGGGAADNDAAGGGGGGRVVSLALSAATGNWVAGVGAAGAGGAAGANAGVTGGDSTVLSPASVTYTAPGGGGGGTSTSNGLNGGSSGGGSSNGSSQTVAGSTVSGTPTAGFGNVGGDGAGNNQSSARRGGGGGGAGAAGTSAVSSGSAGDGGDGVAVNDITGETLWGAGGGGASCSGGSTGGLGGAGGGGEGGRRAAGQAATVANSGSGGGGGGNVSTSVAGGSGADGIVIFAYPLEAA